MYNNSEKIITDIISYMHNDGVPQSWYVGITAKPRQRLFNEHNVSEMGGLWIYREAENSEAARAIEQHFLNNIGTAGGPGGGDITTRYVYAYLKMYYTIE